jgi:prophage maintenance system killer protein
MCLSPETIILFNNKALKKYGGFGGGVRSYAEIDKLAEYVEITGKLYGWDDIECICLAVYQIVKNHPFWDANKRTATYVLLNCLREKRLFYTGRPKDLANQIIKLAETSSDQKEHAVLELSYFIKAHLQKREM